MDNSLNLEDLKRRGQMNRRAIQNLRIATFVALCVVIGSVYVGTSLLNNVQGNDSRAITPIAVLTIMGVVLGFMVITTSYQPMSRSNIKRSKQLRDGLHNLSLISETNNPVQLTSTGSFTFLFYIFIFALTFKFSIICIRPHLAIRFICLAHGILCAEKKYHERLQPRCTSACSP